MSPHLSGHLPNLALLALSVGIALAANRLATSPVDAPGARSSAGPEVAPFMTPVSVPGASSRSVVALATDPFGRTAAADDPSAVAPVATTGTVSSTSRAVRRLTAILIADERRIAVIDETTVKVGDTLRDGARVASIQADRVWLSDRNGRMRMLTLSSGVR